MVLRSLSGLQDPAWLKEDEGPFIMARCVSLWTVGTVFVILRLYTRGRVLKHIQLDDYLIIITTLIGWAFVATVIISIKNGFGQHTASLTLEQQSNATFYIFVGFPLVISLVTLPKVAVVSLLTRLLNPSRCHQRFLWGLAWLCVVSGTVNIILVFAQCSPTKHLWDRATEGKCIDPWTLVYLSIFGSALSAFADIYLAIYPACVLWGLKLNIRKKIALSIALGIGLVSCGVAIYKCTRLPVLASSDYLYDAANLTIWGTAEGASIVIASCIPVLRPLVDAIFGQKILDSSSNGTSNPKKNRPSHVDSA